MYPPHPVSHSRRQKGPNFAARQDEGEKGHDYNGGMTNLQSLEAPRTLERS
jgi:hypothetical protein